MYVVEEYLAAIMLAIGLTFTGALVVLLLRRDEEARFLDEALFKGSFAKPPAWPKFWALMKIMETWQRFSVSSSQKVKTVLRRLHIGPRTNSRWWRFCGRIAQEILTRKDAARDWTRRLMRQQFWLGADAGRPKSKGSLLF
jgi:hypothetical protein